MIVVTVWVCVCTQRILQQRVIRDINSVWWRHGKTNLTDPSHFITHSAPKFIIFSERQQTQSHKTRQPKKWFTVNHRYSNGYWIPECRTAMLGWPCRNAFLLLQPNIRTWSSLTWQSDDCIVNFFSNNWLILQTDNLFCCFNSIF